MQANVRRGANAHSIVLKLAEDNQTDILLAHEIWTLRDLSVRRPILHQNFLCFSPLSEWYSHPRALAYVRKSQGLHPHQNDIDISTNCVQIATEGGMDAKLMYGMFKTPWKTVKVPETV
ncbi:BgTH12-04374 [Blumeria graminis f. sp. triticale]|uniref:BgTH12-04374 n=1 Tax=Blumeria graminis f. sp. triticale TaxID=1689686 RepID=A0A9W4GBY2_BLUGR|nr:BgTH12-04374 [Blumeria graminis f. sp. triticale]